MIHVAWYGGRYNGWQIQLVFFSLEALLCEERWFDMLMTVMSPGKIKILLHVAVYSELRPTRLLEGDNRAFLARDNMYSDNYIPACHGHTLRHGTRD